MYIKEADELVEIFSAVTCCHVFNCSLKSANSHLDVWRNAISKVKSCKFLNSLMGFVFHHHEKITISDGRHVTDCEKEDHPPPAGICNAVYFQPTK